MMGVVMLGIFFAILDLGRIGFAQHTLDGAAYDLAHALTAVANTNSTPGNGYTPTPLNPGGSYAQSLIAAAVSAAAREAGNGVSATTLAPSGGRLAPRPPR